MHPSLEPHAAPHALQLELSVFVSTHCPPHAVSPVGHAPVQTPAEQTWAAVHLVPHPPQLAGSFTVGMHWPLQSDW
jgi:hypothetical protein